MNVAAIAEQQQQQLQAVVSHLCQTPLNEAWLKMFGQSAQQPLSPVQTPVFYPTFNSNSAMFGGPSPSLLTSTPLVGLPANSTLESSGLGDSLPSTPRRRSKKKPSGMKPAKKRSPRVRGPGSSHKTALVWQYFAELPAVEQSAQCQLCSKKIKATNSSTTGMIRHVKSCHEEAYKHYERQKGQKEIIATLNKLPIGERLKLETALVESGTSFNASQFSPSSMTSSTNATTASSGLFKPLDTTTSSNAPSSCSLISSADVMSFRMSDFVQNLQENDERARALFQGACTSEQHEAEHQEEEAEDVKENHEPALPSPFPSKPDPIRCGLPAVVKQELDQHIALLLILDKLPLSHVESLGFKTLMNYVCPNYTMPDVTELKTRIIPQLEASLPANYRRLLEQYRSGAGWPMSPSTTVESFEEPDSH